MAEGFAGKLSLVLKALSISRGRLAADLGVDKSLVGRWCNGQVSPSAHNCARLTQAIAVRVPGFTMCDWDLALDGLAARFGVAVPAVEPGPDHVPSGFAEWLKLSKLRDAGRANQATSEALAGIWRTTRATPEMPGRFIHDYAILQTTPDGPSSFRMGIFSSRMIGWAVAVDDQMYCCCTNQDTGASVFAILNRSNRPRIDVLDGVSIACMAGAGGAPVAGAILLERVADLTGDEAVDEARYEELLAKHPIAPEGSIPDEIRDYLLRDTGPTALANGGDPMIVVRALTSRARSAPGAPAPPPVLRAISG